jgi:hypothetical protein
VERPSVVHVVTSQQVISQQATRAVSAANALLAPTTVHPVSLANLASPVKK